MAVEIELDISPGNEVGTYEVRVVRAIGGGEPTGQARLDPEELARWLRELEYAVLASAVRSRGGPSKAEAPLREAGQELFAALFHGAVGETYRASQAVARDRRQALRMVLRLNAPELAVLPWEALFDQELRSYVCLKEPIVRHVPAPSTPEPVTVTGPLQVLGLVAAPRDLEQLDVELERRNFDAALAEPVAAGRLRVEWLMQASWDAVQARLLSGRWHVLHVIGHGDYDPDTDCGRLALVGEDGRADWVEAPRLANLLSLAEPTPRLVVLNSCASGQGGTTDRLSGTAATLVHSGICAVVAMQFRITDRAAIAFPKGFYGALAAGRSVDRAVQAGRVSILGVPHSLEWVTPVLYVRGDESRLFRLPPAWFDEPPPPPPPPGLWRRLGQWLSRLPGRPALLPAAAVAVAVAALVVLAATYALTGRSSPEPLEWVAASAPTPGQQEVLDHVQVWFADAGGCEGTELLKPVGIVARELIDSTVVCSYGDEARVVFFTLPHRADAVDFFDKRLESRDLDDAAREAGPDAPWLVQLPEPRGGRAFGAVHPQAIDDELRAEIGWYRDESRTFAYAFRSDADFRALYKTWSDVFDLESA